MQSRKIPPRLARKWVIKYLWTIETLSNWKSLRSLKFRLQQTYKSKHEHIASHKHIHFTKQQNTCWWQGLFVKSDCWLSSLFSNYLTLHSTLYHLQSRMKNSFPFQQLMYFQRTLRRKQWDRWLLHRSLMQS